MSKGSWAGRACGGHEQQGQGDLAGDQSFMETLPAYGSYNLARARLDPLANLRPSQLQCREQAKQYAGKAPGK